MKPTNEEIARKCGITVEELEFIDLIDQMDTEERRAFRAELERAGCTALPRNLFFNYQTQEWI